MKKPIKDYKLIKEWKRWGYYVGGLVLVVIAFMLAGLYGSNRDSAGLALGFIVGAAGGVFLIYRGWKRGSESTTVVVGIEKPPAIVNSLNIYAIKDSTGYVLPLKIAFEWMDEPLGQQQQCLNNSNWYYVHIIDIATDKLKAFVLPDRQYFDPREFANVINMPAHKKLFTRKATLLQQIAPWAMVVAFMASIFGLLVTTPAV